MHDERILIFIVNREKEVEGLGKAEETLIHYCY